MAYYGIVQYSAVQCSTAKEAELGAQELARTDIVADELKRRSYCVYVEESHQQMPFWVFVDTPLVQFSVGGRNLQLSQRGSRHSSWHRQWCKTALP